jgi:hypothetical protein
VFDKNDVAYSAKRRNRIAGSEQCGRGNSFVVTNVLPNFPNSRMWSPEFYRNFDNSGFSALFPSLNATHISIFVSILMPADGDNETGSKQSPRNARAKDESRPNT